MKLKLLPVIACRGAPPIRSGRLQRCRQRYISGQWELSVATYRFFVLTDLGSGVGDGGGVAAGLRTPHSAYLELVARAGGQAVQNHVLVSGDGRQRLAERLDRLIVDVVVARVVYGLSAADRRVHPL